MTATAAFGAGKRENHDASAFYARFTAPETTTNDEIVTPSVVDRLFVGDARHVSHDQIADNSVALLVTSPPYFVGKEYEADITDGSVPATYLEYLSLLTEVFAVSLEKVEPGGRIAVNVANLGRRPYRSLSADVIGILQDELGLLLRGEIIWQKARGASGSCAWGSYRSPQNPVLRDTTERIIVASKGRFDRAIQRKDRATRRLPSAPTISTDDFLEATLDVWEIAPESARAVGHPAPFPVELPQRLIDLYTYENDLVYDPFMGVGSTAVAALRRNRHYVGFDTSETYVHQAERRITKERRRLAEREQRPIPGIIGPPPAAIRTADDAADQGVSARALATGLITEAGFGDVAEKRKVAPAVTADVTGIDRSGRPWAFFVVGGFTTQPTGLSRSEALFRVLGKASVAAASGTRILILTPDLPEPKSPLAKTLATSGVEALDILDPGTLDRLGELARS